MLTAVAWRSTAQLRRAPADVDALLARIGQVGPRYLHVDLDVLDPVLVPGVVYPAPDGMSLSERERLLRSVQTHDSLAAITLTALNVTDGDPAGALATAVAVAQAVLNSRRYEHVWVPGVSTRR